jgi:hypothetical protein
MQCKYLLLNVPKEEVEKTYNYKSIDEAAEVYSHEHEDREDLIDPETEFFGHCSNLQAWYEHDYDTRILERRLAFPLLKALANAGDPKAKQVFQEEVAKRFIEGNRTVREYLIVGEYLQELTPEQLKTIKAHENFPSICNQYFETLISHPHLYNPENPYLEEKHSETLERGTDAFAREFQFARTLPRHTTEVSESHLVEGGENLDRSLNFRASPTINPSDNDSPIINLSRLFEGTSPGGENDQ